MNINQNLKDLIISFINCYYNKKEVILLYLQIINSNQVKITKLEI